jgi:hypothetical protein
MRRPDEMRKWLVKNLYHMRILMIPCHAPHTAGWSPRMMPDSNLYPITIRLGQMRI